MRASPVTGFRITPSSGVRATAADADGLLRTSAVTAVNVPRRVLPATPITTASLNISFISMAVQQFHHFADSLRTRQVHARLVASGDIAPLDAVGLAALVLVTGFRTTPCTCVCATAGATAIASVTVLDTTAFTTSRTLRHSIAVEAPLRRVLRRPSPFACAPGFFVPDRLRGLWFSHATQRAVGPAILCPGCFGVLWSRQGRYSLAWETWWQFATRPVFGKNTCVEIQGLVCVTSRLQQGLNRQGVRSFPKDSAFSQGAHAPTGA